MDTFFSSKQITGKDKMPGPQASRRGPVPRKNPDHPAERRGGKRGPAAGGDTEYQRSPKRKRTGEYFEKYTSKICKLKTISYGIIRKLRLTFWICCGSFIGSAEAGAKWGEKERDGWKGAMPWVASRCCCCCCCRFPRRSAVDSPSEYSASCWTPRTDPRIPTASPDPRRSWSGSPLNDPHHWKVHLRPESYYRM